MGHVQAITGSYGCSNWPRLLRISDNGSVYMGPLPSMTLTPFWRVEVHVRCVSFLGHGSLPDRRCISSADMPMEGRRFHHGSCLGIC